MMANAKRRQPDESPRSGMKHSTVSRRWVLAPAPEEEQARELGGKSRMAKGASTSPWASRDEALIKGGSRRLHEGKASAAGTMAAFSSLPPLHDTTGSASAPGHAFPPLEEMSHWDTSEDGEGERWGAEASEGACGQRRAHGTTWERWERRETEIGDDGRSIGRAKAEATYMIAGDGWSSRKCTGWGRGTHTAGGRGSGT
jgi:hypothetical protein